MKVYGDTLFAGIASSGTIRGELVYPEWYTPIQEFAPQDCVASINGIIDKFDALVATGNREAVNTFKSLFGLSSVTDDRDFAQTIAFPIGGPMNYPTSTWQELGWDPSFGSDDFWNFCNNVTNLYAPENITANDYILSNYTNGEPWTNLGNYANYVSKYVTDVYCPSPDLLNTPTCFGTQNQTYYADTTNSATRSYLYSSCTESGTYQAAPETGPSLLSRVVKADYTQQWCNWAFPPGKFNSIDPNGPNLTWYNKYSINYPDGSFDFKADRLAMVDGAQDVWLDQCYHSRRAPLRTTTDLTLHPELLISGSGHHWDSYGIGDINAEPQFIRNAHLWEIRTVARWLRYFPSWKPKSKKRSSLPIKKASVQRV